MFARLMGVATISPVELLALVERRAVTVIDVNARSSWLRARAGSAHARSCELPGTRSSRQSRCADGVLLLQSPLPKSTARCPPRQRIRIHERPGDVGRHQPLDGREAADGI